MRFGVCLPAIKYMTSLRSFNDFLSGSSSKLRTLIHFSRKSCHYFVTSKKILEIILQALLASGRLGKSADDFPLCSPELQQSHLTGG
jgi:hypothetical protein